MKLLTRQLIATAIGTTILLLLCNDSDLVLDFCYDVLCINESDELLLSDFDYVLNVFLNLACCAWVLLLDDSQCRWCTLWLYNIYLKLSKVNQASLSILLQFLTLFQRYLACLVRYLSLADFYSHNSEESSFCLPFV